MQQAVLRLLMTFKRSIRKNMKNSKTTLAQMGGNQNAAMTIERFFFSTHQCDPHFCRALNDSINSSLECRRAGNQTIICPTVYVTFTFRPSRAEFLAKENIRDTVFLQGALKRRAIKVRVVLTVRGRANIGHCLNVVLLQQRQKLRELQIGMADCEHRL